MAMTPEARRTKRIAEAAAEAEARAARDAERHKAWRENGTRLSWEDLLAGEPCRGCGQTILPDSALVDLPPEQREVEYERRRRADEQRFATEHGNCHGFRMSMSGSPITHCGECCPPFPLSPGQIDALAKIVVGAAAHPNPNLVRWSITLSCGHSQEMTADQHHEYEPARRHFSPVYQCKTCAEQRAIIAAERLGTDKPPTPRPKKTATRSEPRRSAAAIRREIATTEKRLTQLRALLDDEGEASR